MIQGRGERESGGGRNRHQRAADLGPRPSARQQALSSTQPFKGSTYMQCLKKGFLRCQRLQWHTGPEHEQVTQIISVKPDSRTRFTLTVFIYAYVYTYWALNIIRQSMTLGLRILEKASPYIQIRYIHIFFCFLEVPSIASILSMQLFIQVTWLLTHTASLTHKANAISHLCSEAGYTTGTLAHSKINIPTKILNRAQVSSVC